MNKAWHLRDFDSKKADLLSANLGISLTLSRVLLNRGISEMVEAERFLFHTLYDLHDPYLLKDMSLAVDRIKMAIVKGEKVMVLGDYDVDGITSLALLYEFFRINNLDPIPYLPHRIDEGYGISDSAVSAAISSKVDLFISVDCGITAISEIEKLKNSGVDVIVIDHHRPKDNLHPPADAIIDPWQNDCSYPDKDLAAVGLVFKVLEAMLGIKDERLLGFLDLVCLGTVADVASLKGENRILIKEGLKILAETERVGLKELFNAASLSKDKVSVRNIAFVLGPRLNAAGRIDSAEDAFRLLISKDKIEAEALASKLEESNRRRREIEAEILKESLRAVDQEVDFSKDNIVIVKGRDWHPGVLGIVASKLADKYYRPSIVFSESDILLKGSGRSIPDFNIFKAVSLCTDILEEFGGHAAACGISLKRENWTKFKSKMFDLTQEAFKEVSLVSKIELDGELDFGQMNDSFFKDLELLEPFGTENSEPLFLTSSVKVVSSIRPLARNFYKFWVRKGDFSQQVLYKDKDGDNLPKVGELIDIAYIPSVGIWKGVKSVTLFLEDFRLSKDDA
ncbi:MAG: single-stranded-DNA-specific exonuclease RecJ [Candidatus Kaelpia aquatica]|nr:single-stranded-DNA-specific exonuclease RecJ [Candidatus Kaelpia aquatica]